MADKLYSHLRISKLFFVHEVLRLYYLSNN